MTSKKLAITQTMRTFGYPQTLVAEYEWWSVLLRRKAVTLGSLVLAAKVNVPAFGDLPQSAFTELASITSSLEAALKVFCAYEKINYLMLMMVDPEPHFHIIPRYEGSRKFDDVNFDDAGWLGAPALSEATSLGAEMTAKMIQKLKTLWPHDAQCAGQESS